MREEMSKDLLQKKQLKSYTSKPTKVAEVMRVKCRTCKVL